MPGDRLDRNVTCTIAGRQHRLRLNHSAVDAFERESGLSLITLAMDPQQIARSTRQQILLLWACLQAESEGLTSIKDVGEMLDRHCDEGGDKGPIYEAVAKALELSEVFPKAAKPKPEGEGKAAADAPAAVQS